MVRKAYLLLSFILLVFIESFSQAGNAQNTATDPRHETISQRIISVLFDQNIFSATTAGWSVTVNGIAVTVNSVAVLGTRVQVTIDASAAHAGQPFVIPGDVVRISYSQATGNTLTATAGNPEINSFTNFQSKNNWVFNCAQDLVFFQQGLIPASSRDICAPVIMNFTQYQYKWSLRFRNSSNYNLGVIRYNILWGDGVNENWAPYQSDATGAANPTFIENTGFDGTNPGVILTSRPTHNYPATTTPAPNICSWDLTLTPLIVGLTTCTSLAQTTIFPTYDNDQTNSGTLNMQPEIANSHRVCLGTNVGMRFSDQTLLNCRLAAPEATVPNDLTRWIRIVYGSTNYGPGNIADIRVGGVPVTSNADEGPLLFPTGYFPTGAGGIGVPDFNGVIELATPVTAATATAFMQNITTLATTFHEVGERFYVRIDYWNVCNPYNPVSPDANRVSIENYVEIITKPASPVATNKEYCFSEVIGSGGTCGAPTGEYFEVTSASVAGSTEIKWYNTLADATADINTIASSYGTNCRFLRPENRSGGVGAMAAAGVYSVFVRHRTGAAPPNNCLSDPIQVTITRRSALSAPGVISPLTSDVCDGTNNVPFSLPAAPPVVAFGGATEYSWTFTGGAGATVDAPGTTQNITADFNVGGAFTITTRTLNVVTQFATNATTGGRCPTSSSTRDVTIYGPTLGGTASGGANYCQGADASDISLSGQRGSVIRWEVNFNSSGFVDAGVGAVTSFDPGVLPPGNYVYRAVVANGPCLQQNSTTTTIDVFTNPAPASAGPDQNLCIAAPLDAVLAGSNPAPGTGTWTRISGPGAAPTFTPNATTANATVRVFANGVHVFRWTVVNGSCTSFDEVSLDFGTTPPVSNAGGDQDVCGLTTAMAGNDPTFATGTWSQTAGPGTSAFVNVNDRFSPVTVTVPGTYTYRWRLSSGTCAPSDDFVQVIFRDPPTVSAPADFTSCLDGGQTDPFDVALSGTFGGGATQARWVVQSGTGVFASNLTSTGNFDNASPATDTYKPSAADFAAGSVILRLETNDPVGACVVVNDPVTITFDRLPANAAAGADFAICGDNTNLAGTAATNGGTGTWSVGNALYYETFTLANGTGLSGPNPHATVFNHPSGWSITAPNANTLLAADDYLRVQSNLMEAQDVNAELVWRSPSINITALPNITVSIQLAETGTMEGTDYIRAFYRINGGAEVLLGEIVDDAATDAAFSTFSVTGLTGNTLEVVVRVANDAGAEFHRFDNVFVSSAGAVLPFIVDINSPTSAVSGIPVGNTTFTWTVTSALGVCSSSNDQVIITRHATPVNNNQAPALCEDTFGGGTANVTLVFLQSLNDAITGIPGSVGRTVQFFTDPARTIPYPASASLANTDVVYTIVTRTDVTPNCQTNGTVVFTINSRPVALNQTPEYCEDLPVGSNTKAGIDLTLLNNAVKNNVAANSVAWFTDALATIPVGTPTNVTANDGTTFFAQVTDVNGCTNIAQVEIQLNPLPTPNAIIGAANVCVDPTAINLYQITTINAGYTYTWSIPDPPFDRFAGGGPAEFFVLLAFPVIVNPGQDISVIETSDKGCVGLPNVLNITVESSPPPITINGPAAVCENETGVVYDVANLANTTYSWTVPVGSSIINGQGTNQITVNFGTTAGLVQVVPTTTTGCAGTPDDLGVAINPRPSLNPLSNTVCSDNPGGITLAGPGANTFNITNVTVPPGLNPPARATINGALSTEIFNDVFTNLTGGNLTVQYTVVPVSALNCTGTAGLVNLTIRPEPILAPGLTDAICSGSESVSIVLGVAAGSSTADQYEVTSVNTNGLTPVAGNPTNLGIFTASVLLDDRWENLTGAPVNVEYFIRPINSVTGCIGDPPVPVIVTVNPEPVVNSPVAETICSDTSPTITLTSTIPASSFTWIVKSISGLITGASNGSGATITNVLVNSALVPGSVTYEVVATAPGGLGGCPSDPVDVVITVDPAPIANSITDTECSDVAGGNTFAIDLTSLHGTINGGGGITYAWFEDLALTIPIAAPATYTATNGDPVFVEVDNGQCARVATVTYTINPRPSVTSVVSATFNGFDVSCFGASNGQITATPADGVGPYQFSIDGGTTFFASPIFNGLGVAGNPYVVRVQDSNGCTNTAAPISLIEPPIVSGNAVIAVRPGFPFNNQHVSCNSATDGEITVTGLGGTGVYTFRLQEIPSNTSGDATGTYTGLGAGTYSFVIRDNNGCQFTTPTVTIVQPTPVTAVASLTSPVTCNGDSDGVITVTGGGGTLVGPTYQFTLNQPPGTVNTTGSFTGLAAGTYTITVRDDNGCTRVSNSVIVTQPTVLTVFSSVTSNYNGAKISCPGANDGQVTAFPNGGNGGYTFVLDQDLSNLTGNADGSYENLAPGNYSVTVTDLGGCTVTSTLVNIVEPLPVVASGLVTGAISCNGSSDGQITVSGTGGTGAYTFEQVVPAGPTNGTGTFIGLADGTYDFEVRDLNLCADIVQVTITQPLPVTASALVTSNYNGAQISCNGLSDGVITVTGSGGTGIIQFVFDQFMLSNTTGQFSGVFTGVPAGVNYTFTARDANNCSVVTAPVTVTQPTPVDGTAAITSNYNGEDISCVGSTDGQITVSANGGTGAYSFKLDQAPTNTSGDTDAIYDGVGAGNYTITIRDANNCFKVTPVVVIVPPLAINASLSVTSNYNGRQISCTGASDGNIATTVSGGVSAYAFLLVEIPGNLSGAASGSFTGVPAGSYRVQVTDLNGCVQTTSPITVSEPTVVTSSTAITSNYSGAQISCNGASDGTIRVTPGGGTPGYTFNIVEIPANSTGDASGIYTGISAGTYTFEVRDVNNCLTTSTPITINQPTAVTASSLVTSNYNGSQISCFGVSDGIITVTGGGGTGTLSYLFDNIPANTTGQFSGVFIGVPAGTAYTFTVRDLNNCQVTSSPLDVVQPAQVTGIGSVISNYNGEDIRCVGSTDGSIQVVPGGGTGAFVFQLNQDPGNVSGNVNGIYTNVGAGSYTVTVRDANSCFIITAPVIVSPPADLTAAMAVTSNYNGAQISCNGAGDGILTVTAGGGVPGYTYVLNPPVNTSGDLTGVYNNIPAGSYTVLVTDLNGCQKTSTATIVVEPAVLVPSVAITSNYNGEDVSCNGASDGVIQITQTGGTSGYTYSFVEIPANVTGQANGIFTGIPAGTYTFIVEDINNCSATTTPISVTEPTPINAAASITSNYNGEDISCNGANDGIITVTSSGGTGTPTFVFDQFALTNQTGRFSGVFTSVQPGLNYTFTATDVNGCNIQTLPLTVTEPAALTSVQSATSDFNGFDVSCFNFTDGQITVTPSGGTAPLNFLLLENPGNVTGQTTGVFDGLRAGNYRVRITDVNGCLITTPSVAVIQPTDLNISIGITSNYNGFNLSCFGANDGQVSVTSSGGGAGGYQFELFENSATTGNLSGQVSGVFTGLVSGVYDVNISDLNGCVKKSLPVVIIDPLPLFEGILGFDQGICFNQDNPDPFTELAPAFGSIGNYVYQWQESTDGVNFTDVLGATSATFDPPATLAVKTFYKRIITSGCETLESNEVSVTVNSIPTATLTPSQSPVCEGEFFILNFQFSNGTAPYFFDYDNGTTFTNDRIGADVTPVPVLNYTNTTTFTLTELRDFNGCFATTLPIAVTVPVSKINPNFNIVGPTAQCSGNDFTFTWNVDANIDYTWTWADGQTDVIAANSLPVGLNTIVHNYVSLNTSGSTNFPVILSAINNVDMCGPKQSNQTITIHPNILINLFPDKNEVCSGEPVTINNPTLGGSQHTWQVIRQSDTQVIENRGPFAAASNQTFTINNNAGGALNPDTYHIVYTVTNGLCTAADTVPVTVYREIIAGFNEGTVPEFIGGNATVTYTNTSAPIDLANFSYTWEFGTAGTPANGTGAGPFTIDYSAPGLKTVRITAVNTVAQANGISCSSVYEETINILLPALVAVFDYAPDSTCFPTKVRITQNNATGDSFQWRIVDQNGRTAGTSTIPLPEFDIVNPGEYTIFLTTSNSITGQTAFADNSGTGPNAMPGKLPIQVFNLPLASFQARPTTLFVPDTELVTFNFSTASAPPADSVNFWWNFGDTNDIVKQDIEDPDPTYFYPVEGLYTVTMVMREVRGTVVCVDTVTQLITAKEGGIVKIPNAFTPDPTGPGAGAGGGSGNTAVNDVFLPLVKGINLREEGTFLMQIYDRWGNLVFESRNNSTSGTVMGWDGYDRNGNLFPAGVYVYKLGLRLVDGQNVTQVGDVTLIR